MKTCQCPLRLLLIILTFQNLAIFADSRHADIWPTPRPIGQNIPPCHDKELQSNPEALYNHNFAGPTGMLNLAAALSWTLNHNPELEAARRAVLAEADNSLQDGTWSNPELEIEAEEFAGWGVSHTRKDWFGAWNSGGTWQEKTAALADTMRQKNEAETRHGFRSAETTLRISQLFETGGKRTKRREAGLLGARAAGHAYENKKMEILVQTKALFIELLAAQEQYRIAGNLFKLTQEIRDDAVARVKAGKVAPVEESKANVEVVAMRIAVEKSRRAVEVARIRLASLWGSSQPQFGDAHGSLGITLSLPSLSTLREQLPLHPEIAALEKTHAQNLKKLDLAKAERLPDLTASLGVSRYEAGNGYALKAALSLPLPVLNRNRYGISAAEHEVEQIAQERQAAYLSLLAELHETYANLESSIDEVRAIDDELLPGAKTAFEAMQHAYREGKSTLVEVLDAQRMLFDVQTRRLEAVAEFNKEAANLELLCGIPISAFDK